MSPSSKKSLRKNSGYRPGDVYSVRYSKETFAAVKVLVVERKAIHLCLYSQRFKARPSSIRSQDLAVLSRGEGDGLGILHLPMQMSAFMAWKPRLLLRTEVTDDELVGYNTWKSSGGGLWG
jgi:hypothetical protein